MLQSMMFPVPQAEARDKIKTTAWAIVAEWAFAIATRKTVDAFHY